MEANVFNFRIDVWSTKLILAWRILTEIYVSVFTYPQIIPPYCITSTLFSVCLVLLSVESLPSFPLFLIFIKLQDRATCKRQAKHKRDNCFHFDDAWVVFYPCTGPRYLLTVPANSGMLAIYWRKSQDLGVICAREYQFSIRSHHDSAQELLQGCARWRPRGPLLEIFVEWQRKKKDF